MELQGVISRKRHVVISALRSGCAHAKSLAWELRLFLCQVPKHVGIGLAPAHKAHLAFALPQRAPYLRTFRHLVTAMWIEMRIRRIADDRVSDWNGLPLARISQYRIPTKCVQLGVDSRLAQAVGFSRFIAHAWRGRSCNPSCQLIHQRRDVGWWDRFWILVHVAPPPCFQ